MILKHFCCWLIKYLHVFEIHCTSLTYGEVFSWICRFIYRYHLEKEGHIIWTWYENDKGIFIRVFVELTFLQDAMATALKTALKFICQNSYQPQSYCWCGKMAITLKLLWYGHEHILGLAWNYDRSMEYKMHRKLNTILLIHPKPEILSYFKMPWQLLK